MTKSPALREKVRSELLDRVLHHQLRPASRIREDAMAAELGASRTPLREALFSLVHEGLIDATPDRGFSVKPLSSREVREVYPILWTLESLAVQTSRRNFSSVVSELRALNGKFRAAVRLPHVALRYDTRWHVKLISLCPNQRLISMVSTLKRLSYRYEFLYMTEPDLLLASVEDHAKIIKDLANNRIDDAAGRLQQHWNRGMQALLDQFDWM